MNGSSKLDEDLVDEIRAKVFKDTGHAISKDDPIMLNAHVVKAIFDITVEDAKEIVSNIVCRDIDKIDQLTKHTKESMEMKEKSFTLQCENFLERFNTALNDHSKNEVISWEEANETILRRIKVNQFWIFAFNILIFATLIYFLAQ